MNSYVEMDVTRMLGIDVVEAFLLLESDLEVIKSPEGAKYMVGKVVTTHFKFTLDKTSSVDYRRHMDAAGDVVKERIKSGWFRQGELVVIPIQFYYIANTYSLPSDLRHDIVVEKLSDMCREFHRKLVDEENEVSHLNC